MRFMDELDSATVVEGHELAAVAELAYRPNAEHSDPCPEHPSG
jgi:hypothetical protein